MTPLGSRNKTPDSLKKPDISEENIERIFTRTDGIFKCSKCEYQTGKKYTILQHFKRHKEVQIHDNICTICGHIFKTSQDLKNHMRSHRRRSRPKPFLCDDCDGCFRHAGELQRHVRYKHTLEKPHKCTICSYAAVERSKLALHMKCHIGELPHKCPHCTYASNNRSKLKVHLYTHSGEKPYKCEICNTKYTQAKNLKSHLKRKHSEKSLEYSCNTCHAVYPTMFTLKQHLRNLHAYVGLQSCTKCDASFTDRYTLNNHVKMHKRRTKSQCGICQHTTRTKNQVTHTQQSRSLLECENCDSCFTSQASLTRHVKEHHESTQIYVCNNCGKSYLMRHNLVLHLKTNCNTQASNKPHTQDTNDSPDLSSITKNLKDGEVIVLPEKGGQNYVLIEILSLGKNCNHRKTVAQSTSSAKEDILKEFYVETENNRLEIKIEVERDFEMTDEDEQPFFGF